VSPIPSVTFVKQYATPARCQQATANHGWLGRFAAPMRLPIIHAAGPRHLHFEYADGSHVTPADLVAVAAHLGEVHGSTYHRQLLRARLDVAFDAGDGHSIAGFLARRLDAVERLLTAGAVRSPGLSVAEARARMLAAVHGPVAFYKDTNPRNLLLTSDNHDGAAITVDFDDLTLAPFGYDLAKLVVTLAMTYGRIPRRILEQALDAYNLASARAHHDLGGVSFSDFLTWAEIHHILTIPYLGRAGYRHAWSDLRPYADAEAKTSTRRTTEDLTWLTM